MDPIVLDEEISRALSKNKQKIKFIDQQFVDSNRSKIPIQSVIVNDSQNNPTNQPIKSEFEIVKRDKFKWLDCMNLSRQFPINISQKVNTKEKIEAVFNFPKYTSIHQQGNQQQKLKVNLNKSINVTE